MSASMVPAEAAELVESSFERRGPRLAPLQTNFSRPTAAHPNGHPRMQRPRPSNPINYDSEELVSLQSPVKRQTSKNSLRSLFGRDRTTRAVTALDNKLAEIEESQQSQSQKAGISNGPLSPSLTSPRTAHPTSDLTSPTTPRPRITLKTAKSKAKDTNAHSQGHYGWKPPPLFQAYPQSTKHENLTAPAMSADSILRLNATLRKGAAEDGRGSGLGQIEAKKQDQRERRHLRTLSGTINKMEWTRKIYVLANVGYILQYAGEGKHDRLPEKMLQLGPHSVAFASDAIPGKHWVIQVSQNPANDASSVATDTNKTRLGRFGFHRSNPRRLTHNFLLVFENPDSMISWLTAIRTEIEARGGPKFTGEKQSIDDPEPGLHSQSGVRQMVKKDPHRSSSLFLQPQTHRLPDEIDGQSFGGMTLQSRRNSYVSINPRSIVDSRSGSVSTGWTEATEPTNGSDGLSSSFASSNLPGSPLMASGSTIADELLHKGFDPMVTRSPPSSSLENRQSFYGGSKAHPIYIAGRAEVPPSSQPSAILPETLIRSASPPAPNFSMPSFSKKFVSRPGPTSVTSASSPPSVAGVLRQGESAGDACICSIASPPQSPTYSVASSHQADMSEPPTVARDITGRRILRSSNSEDALSRIVRPTHNAPNFCRVPRPNTPSETSPPPSRPISLAGRPGLGIQMNGEPQMEIHHSADQNPRNPYNGAHAMQNMSRRKSMPGLIIGPPAAPPPNCPLPKIPSPIAAQALPTWSTNPPADRFYQSAQIHGFAQDKRKSTLVSGIPIFHTNGSRAAARQSKMIQ